MEKNIHNLYNEFRRIKEMGWIKSRRTGSTGIGMTFEDLLGKKEDMASLPDYQGIEIKTRRYYTNMFINLFSASPKGNCSYEVKRLADEYGYPDKDYHDVNVLKCNVYANDVNYIYLNYYFQLNVDREKEKIWLYVYNNETGELIDDTTYWNFEDLKTKLVEKDQTIAVVDAIRKFIDNNEYFKYFKISFYKFKDFETFLKLVEDGTIFININGDVYKSGEHKGEFCTHGTFFRIPTSELEKLFTICNTPHY